MITRKDARREVSAPTKCKENQAGDIIDAEVVNNIFASDILKDSVLGRTLRDRPANEDLIRGIA